MTTELENTEIKEEYLGKKLEDMDCFSEFKVVCTKEMNPKELREERKIRFSIAPTICYVDVRNTDLKGYEYDI